MAETTKITSKINPEGKQGRGVPGVSAAASPASGYSIMISEDTWMHGSGISAVAPLYAGMLARIIEKNKGKSLGFINPEVYQNHTRHS